MRNLIEENISFLKIYTHEICEGDERYDSTGIDDVAYFEESKMGSNTYSVNYNDYLVSVFDASTCSGDNVYEFF